MTTAAVTRSRLLRFFAHHQVQLNICLRPQDYVLGDREGEVGLLVKAGLHEVDMVKRRMQPCYWPGTLHRVIRGSWYVDKGSGYAPLKVRAQSAHQSKT